MQYSVSAILGLIDAEDFAKRDLHSFLRKEVISKTLYLCKDAETFGSGLRKNKNATIPEVVDNCGKSIRTVNRVISSLKSKKLIERIGTNKTGYWKVV